MLETSVFQSLGIQGEYVVKKEVEKEVETEETVKEEVEQEEEEAKYILLAEFYHPMQL